MKLVRINDLTVLNFDNPNLEEITVQQTAKTEWELYITIDSRCYLYPIKATNKTEAIQELERILARAIL